MAGWEDPLNALTGPYGTIGLLAERGPGMPWRQYRRSEEVEDRRLPLTEMSGPLKMAIMKKLYPAGPPEWGTKGVSVNQAVDFFWPPESKGQMSQAAGFGDVDTAADRIAANLTNEQQAYLQEFARNNNVREGAVMEFQGKKFQYQNGQVVPLGGGDMDVRR